LIDNVLRQLEYNSKFTEIESNEYLEVNDPKDRCFYAVTLSGRKSVDALLVTGNIRHFPEEPFIVTPTQFVNMLEIERNKQLE
jgi:predicted nucleic acid-binding protein